MLEDAAYRRMLDLYYASERPLPLNVDGLYRLVRARSKEEKLAVDTVLGEFFVKGETGWLNKRADEEISKSKEKTEKARASASVRWHSDKDANAMRTHSEGNAPKTNNQKPNTPLAPSGAFLRFWGAWPRHSRKQSRGSCWDRWRKQDLDEAADQIIAHVEAMKLSIDWRKDSGAFIPAPLVYLTQRRWEGADLNTEPEKRMVV